MKCFERDYFSQFTLWENGKPYSKPSEGLSKENSFLKAVIKAKDQEIYLLQAKLKSYEGHYLRKRGEVKELKELVEISRQKKAGYKTRLHNFLELAEYPKALSSLMGNKCETEAQLKIQSQQLKVLSDKLNVLFKIMTGKDSFEGVGSDVEIKTSPDNYQSNRRPSCLGSRKESFTPDVSFKGELKGEMLYDNKGQDHTQSFIIFQENVLFFLYQEREYGASFKQRVIQ